MICKNCNNDYEAKGEFCPHCGFKNGLEKHCTSCGAKVSENAKFCTSCGKHLQKQEEKKTPKCYDIFAIIGFAFSLLSIILGIVSIGDMTSNTTYINFMLVFVNAQGIGFSYLVMISAIVFSALGKKSTSHHGKAVTGLVISIVNICIVTLFAMTVGAM